LNDESHPATFDTSAKVLIVDTPQGPVTINPKCPPGFFERLRLDSGLGNFSRYSSIIQKLEVFERVASAKDGRVALALFDENVVVAYMTCSYPDSDERWSKLGELMYEFSVIESSRNFRKMHIATAMVRSVLQEGFLEEKIAFINGFSWHWDVDGNGLSLAQYRKMMLNFMKPLGFQEYYTNEPNIALRQENLFMARIGSKVSPEDQLRFRNLRFGMTDRK